MDVSDKAGTLRAQEHGHQPIICFKERAGKPGGGKGILIGEDKTFTLSTMQQDTICYSVENHPNDSRVKIREDGTVQTLSARCGTGGGQHPMRTHMLRRSSQDTRKRSRL